MDPFILPVKPVLIFLVVLARVGGLVTFAPFWGHKAAPVQIRILLALALALALTPPLVDRLPAPPDAPIALAVVLVLELVIGIVFGLVGKLVFSGLEVAAQVIGYQMGFSLASTIDPSTRAQTAALGIVAQMLGLVVFMAADGHHWLLRATVHSFQKIGPGQATISADLVQLFLRLSGDALAVGVALAAPAIVMLLAVEFTLAVIGRAIPQIQVMVLGFPLKIAAGLWLIGTSLYFMPGAIRATLVTIERGLGRAIAAL
ncbi:MAG TPA: flagellar biosynthetic protein FliR [Pyrinomonadaceae bacterium]|nr:flagellar biosynthetic protein FliR [Pyrinomonadaceae bacterium]